MRKPRIPRPRLRTTLLVASIALIVVVMFFIFSSMTKPQALDLHFKGGKTVKTEGERTLVVEYKNTRGRDIPYLNIEVEPVHKSGEKINIVKPRDHEKMIGKGQIRQFEFPVVFQDLREGSTYAIEVRSITPHSNITKRISLKVEGGE